MTVSNVVGQGVFLKARAMTCDVGSPGLVLAAWIVAGLLSLAGALTLAELGALHPESGGPYAFLRRAYGELGGFPYAWITLLIGAPASTAALAAGTAIFARAIAPQFVDAFGFAIPGTALHVAGAASFAIAITGLLAAVNLAPALFNGGVSIAFGALKIAMLVAIPAVVFAFGKPVFAQLGEVAGNAACAGIAPSLRGGLAGFAAALIGALYSYLGWASLPMIAGEIALPGRNIPRALGTSMIGIVIAYVAANASYFLVLSPHAIANAPAGTSVGVAAIEHVFGPSAGRIGAALLFLSVLSTLHVTLMSWPRVIYAAACDGIVPRALGRRARPDERAARADGPDDGAAALGIVRFAEQSLYARLVGLGRLHDLRDLRLAPPRSRCVATLSRLRLSGRAGALRRRRRVARRADGGERSACLRIRRRRDRARVRRLCDPAARRDEKRLRLVV